MRHSWTLLLSAALLVAGCSAQEGAVSPAPKEPSTKTQAPAASPTVKVEGRWVTISKVSDGDTVELVEGKEKVRLIGCNTPETVKPGTKPMPYGKEASDFSKSQLLGKKVFMSLDVQKQDQYGRTLAYLFMQEPKTEADLEAFMYNAILLREGYAQVMTIPPNVKYADLFVKLSKQAREQNKGLWALGIYKDEAKSSSDVFIKGKEPAK